MLDPIDTPLPPLVDTLDVYRSVARAHSEAFRFRRDSFDRLNEAYRLRAQARDLLRQAERDLANAKDLHQQVRSREERLAQERREAFGAWRDSR